LLLLFQNIHVFH
jgi:GTP-binding nuclear protein Ran